MFTNDMLALLEGWTLTDPEDVAMARATASGDVAWRRGSFAINP